MIEVTQAGLYCRAGDFHIDPWRPTSRAILTHAHSDHARYGSERYLTSTEGEHVLRKRLGENVQIDTLAYGESIDLNGVNVSLHPAGHVLGSSQVRVEYRGEVWVVTGDFKLGSDATCSEFEPVACHTLISECTFGLPIYRWEKDETLFASINAWWRNNATEGRPSVLFAYSLGKAQRLIAGVDASIGPIFCHGAVEGINRAYRETGIALPETHYAGRDGAADRWSSGLIVAPPSTLGSVWLRKFKKASTAFASGWMMVRGNRRRRNVDRGFVVSDHADWNGLIEAIDASQAERVLLTHGQTGPMVRYLQQQGLEANALSTLFTGEDDDMAVDTATEDDEESVSGQEGDRSA